MLHDVRRFDKQSSYNKLNFLSTESRLDYRGIDSISQNQNDFMVLGRDRVLHWAIDRITRIPYHRWVSRIVDRLLMAIEGGTSHD